MCILIPETGSLRPEIYRFSKVDSTNAFLFREGIKGAPEWTACVADEQTAGKGRMDRVWNSPAGKGLWMSVLVRPQIPAADTPLLTYCAALAMSDALQETAKVKNGIKWPNDIVVDGKKICGILCTASFENGKPAFVVIGTGVNLRAGAYPPELADRAISVEEAGGLADRESVLMDYIQRLTLRVNALEAGEKVEMIENVIQRCVTVGREVKVNGSVQVRGVAEGIGHEGELLVRDVTGVLHSVNCGDVSVRGVMGYV